LLGAESAPAVGDWPIELGTAGVDVGEFSSSEGGASKGELGGELGVVLGAVWMTGGDVVTIVCGDGPQGAWGAW
jgi:hypothetical protein